MTRTALLRAAALAASAALAPAPGLTAPPADAGQATDLLRTLVEIDSTEPHGSTASAEALAARFRAAGFAGADVQLLAPPQHPEKANLVVRLRGRGLGRPILWTSHLDVVAADAKDWTTPPFTLTERDGWYYGRGTSDMKGEAAAVALAMIRMRREGLVPDRDIIAAFTADEEAAGHVNGVRWLLAEHRPLIDAEIAFNPDAGGGGESGGRRLFYGVQTAEKAYVTFTLLATSKGGHSSRPEPDNAIYRLSAALTRLSAFRFPVRLTSTTRAFLQDSAVLEPADLRRDMMAVAATPSDAAAVDRLSEHPELNALIRTTCVATMLAAGEAENALPQRAQATIQCRLIPGDKPAEVEQTLRRTLADPALELTLTRPVNPAPETDPDPKVIAAIRQTTRSMWGDLPVVLRMDTGGSDAVFTRAADIPTYGVSSIFADVADNRHHGRDERISKAAFADGVEFTYRLMKRLSALADDPNRP